MGLKKHIHAKIRYGRRCFQHMAMMTVNAAANDAVVRDWDLDICGHVTSSRTRYQTGRGSRARLVHAGTEAAQREGLERSVHAAQSLLFVSRGRGEGGAEEQGLLAHLGPLGPFMCTVVEASSMKIPQATTSDDLWSPNPAPGRFGLAENCRRRASLVRPFARARAISMNDRRL